MSEDKSGNGAVEEPAEQPVLPLFYKQPIPLNAERHAKFGVRGEADMSFAAGTNLLPVNIGEIAIAAKFYPIVFAAEAPNLPIAICGLREGENTFVTEKNLWAENVYIPAYVRRYPFIFMETQDRKQAILCVDEASDLVSEGGDRAFFHGDAKQTEIVDRAMEFCRNFHQQHELTREFAAAMAEHDMLNEDTTEFRLEGNRRIELKGYKVIDREKLNSIDDTVFLEWRKRGWLPVIYYHLMSGSNWPNIFQQAAARAVERGGDEAAPEN